MSHVQAGSLFLMITIGYFTTVAGSGFFFGPLGSPGGTSFCRPLTLGLAMILISYSQTLTQIRLSLIVLGLAAGLYLPSGVAAITAPGQTGKLGQGTGHT